MTKEVLICGSIAFDTIAVFEGHFSDHLLADNLKSLSVSFFVPTLRKDYGGCAGNIAYNLNLLGGKAVPVGTVGQDAEDYLQYMHNLQIDTRQVQVIPESYTPQCYITTDLDNNQIASFHPGAMLQAADNKIKDAGHAGWAIVAPDSKDAMFAHAKRLHELNIPFIFDLGQAMPLFDGADLEQMLSLATILAANDYEASIIEQRTNKTISQMAEKLRAVIVTRGAQGTSLYENGKQTDIPAVTVANPVDPTGCGDAHRAGLLYGLVNNWDLYDACCLANIMGSLKISSKGPQNHKPTKAAIAQELQKHYTINTEFN